MHAREMWRLALAAAILAAALLLGAIESRAQESDAVPGPTEDRVREALRTAISSRVPGDPARIVVSELTLPREFALPEGARLRVLLPGRDRMLGRMSFQLVVVGPQRREAVWASARVEVLADVVVAGRNLGRGEVLAADDLTTGRMPVSRLPAGSVTRADPLVGQRLARRVPVGRPVTERMVEVPPVVRRGDRLTLVVRRPGLTVTAMGEAREDGAPNGVIAVTNLSSRRTVQARVVDAHTAMVEY